MPIDKPMLKGKVEQSKATPVPTHAPDCPKCGSHRHIVNLAGKAHFYCGNCGFTVKVAQPSLEDYDAGSQHVRDGKGKADTVDEMLRCFENTAGKNVADLKLTMPPQWSCPL